MERTLTFEVTNHSNFNHFFDMKKPLRFKYPKGFFVILFIPEKNYFSGTESP